MKRITKIVILIYFSMVMMCSCSKNHAAPVYRTVSQVDIVTKYKNHLIHRQYNTPEKIRPVLLYLRLLKPQGKPVQVDEATDDVYLISISLTDGKKRYYRQASHRYLAKGKGPYKSIDPGQAARFYRILQELPSDV